MTTSSENLSQAEAAGLVDFFADRKIENEQKAELLTALSRKGETADEIAGMAGRLRELAVPLRGMEDAVDTCGTGGSGLPRFNVSTLSAFVLAACGVKVAKHGNKAASGRCGSFDLLESLGINIELDAEAVTKCYGKFGLAFVYARLFHPAMAAVKELRSSLSFPTIFNLIGPLVNPARPLRHVLGVSKKEHMNLMADALEKLGARHALVVHGSDGIDELTITSSTQIIEIRHGSRHTYEITPEEVGLPRAASFEEIAGGDISTNQRIFFELISGREKGRLLDFLLINSAAGLLVADRVQTLREAIPMARNAVANGAVGELFSAYKTFSNSL